AERRVAGPAKPAARPAGHLDLEALKNRRWATRPRPHVDRIASAWLIKRFLDPGAEFVFTAPDELPDDVVPYDMAGVELGHHGDHCTFETLLHRSGMGDRRLFAIAEIVHEADLRDGTFQRDEARGLDLVPRRPLPARWLFGATGRGTARWTEDGAGLTYRGGAAFGWAVLPETSLRDGFVQARFKPIAGREDQAGGVVWRWRDADNYYVARANALED